MLSITPVALAKTRQSHLVDFIYEHQEVNESFGVSPQDTANAIEILGDFDAYTVEILFEATKSVDKAALEVYLVDEIQAMFDTGEIDIYTIYYFLETLKTLGSLETSLGLFRSEVALALQTHLIMQIWFQLIIYIIFLQ